MTTRSALLQALGYAPLLPPAAALALGVALDRACAVPLELSLLAGVAGYLLHWQRGYPRLSESGLLVALIWLALGAGLHRLHREQFAAAEIGRWAAEAPQLAQLRGHLVEEPYTPRRVQEHPLISIPRGESTQGLLEVSGLRLEGGWVPASGRVKLVVDGRLEGLHRGDEVELLGWLAVPRAAMNPGELDHRDRLRDDRIRAELHVRKSPDSVTRLELGWRNSPLGWLAYVRARGEVLLGQQLPPEQARLATALLLGESRAMTQEEWQKFVRTGVIHVLAISGQHLVILGWFLGALFRVAGVGSRAAAFWIGGLLFAYAILTGARPSAMRAAVMVGVLCLARILREWVAPANALALSALVILLQQPTELFQPGFQLSYLAVVMLIWGLPAWFPPRPLTPVEQLIDEFRPIWARLLHGGWGLAVDAYRLTLVLAVVTAPLVLYWQNLISPIGVLLGPPLVLLSTVALLSGFGLLLSELLGGVLTAPLAWLTGQVLGGCDQLVNLADRVPLGSLYLGSIGVAWLAGFYLLLVLATVHLVLQAQRGEPLSVAGRPMGRTRWLTLILGWAALGLGWHLFRPGLDEVRVTTLAVGHGGCTVIQTPDGRVLLYDAGVLSGPEVASRVIAPFLWSQGVRRIDEVFLSHADLDHFNGLPGLLERFPVGQVSITPSFRDKPTPGVRWTLECLEAAGVPLRVLRRGDRLGAGELRLEVLHPPEEGPPGNENARSMVILLHAGKHRVLLTGDLEKEGLEELLRSPARPVDVLIAPHHGSKAANTPALRDWARPRLVIAAQGVPRSVVGGNPYEAAGIPYWSTHEHGAITLHAHRSGLVAESFSRGERLVVTRGSGR